MKRVHPLPTMLTLGNFGCGFAAILLAARALQAKSLFSIRPFGELDPVGLLCLACGCLFLSMLFDMLDGKVARMTGSASQFGGEMDSLADVVSFGVAPAAILTISWIRVEPATAHWWSLVLVCGFIYAACGALRLARYNVDMSFVAKDYFRGLPSPAAAGALASLFWFLHDDPVHARVLSLLHENAETAEQWLTKILAVYMLFIGLLMWTTVRYGHLSNRLLSGRKRLTHVVAALFILVPLVHWPALVLAAGFNGYVLYGAGRHLAHFRRARAARQDMPGSLSAAPGAAPKTPAGDAP